MSLGAERRRLATDQEVNAALDALDERPYRVAASKWPSDLVGLDAPGLYSWWVDQDGAHDLASGLGELVASGRIYAGQTGATKWPSGTTGQATLRSRIGSQHVRGGIRSSTFRLTLAAALKESLKLRQTGARRLDSESEHELSTWIAAHLELATHSFADADPLGDLEHRVLARLGPPLNLDGMPPTPLRLRLSILRQGLVSPADRGIPRPPNVGTGRVEGGPSSGSAPTAAHPTLHDELVAILAEHPPEWTSRDDLAGYVNDRGRYRKKDGTAVTGFQVGRRAYKYPRLFEVDGSRIRLRRT